MTRKHAMLMLLALALAALVSWWLWGKAETTHAPVMEMGGELETLKAGRAS